MAYASFSELLEDARQHGSIGAAVLVREALESELPASDLQDEMARSLDVMRKAITQGLRGETRSQSGLVGGDGKRIADAGCDSILGGVFSDALAYAVATAEVNASMGKIVAAPTGGAAGVLPGVLLAIDNRMGTGDEKVIDALFCAGGTGSVIASKATLSGAAGGCQAEVGAGAAMAAAAGTQLLGGSPEACGHAASFALQGLMGLVCDPVCGLVEIPCVMRNATGASVALASIEMALAGVAFPIPFDEVVDAMSMVGRSIPPSLRETSHGGLATTPTARRICDTLSTE